MKQHTKPCKECPFRRESARGYLGANDPASFAVLAMYEQRMPCHMHWKLQCAGRATMWGNSCKDPRDKSLLVLAVDRLRVFSNIMEFMKHHGIDLKAVQKVMSGG